MEPQHILQQLQQQQQYRSLETFALAGGKITNETITAGQTEAQTLNFCANDYLNLAQHPELKEAAIYAVRHYGCSASSSRLLSGHLAIHQQLEERLASWSGCYEAALSFGSGYLANCGILQAVIEPNTTVLFDRLNHASLVDGLRLVGGLANNLAGGTSSKPLRWQRYRHCDMADLECRLQKLEQQEHKGPVWLVTDSVFSMDGDLAPLRELASLSHKYQFRWLVDEAHAVGIYGTSGAGLVSGLAAELADQLGKGLNTQGPYRLPDFVTANFAKALGSYGGYCLCSQEWKDYLVNFCRSLIYSTGLPPASAAAALAAIQIIQRKCQKTTNCETLPQNSANTQEDYLNNFAQNDAQDNDKPKGAPIAVGLGAKLLGRSRLFYRELEQYLPNLPNLHRISPLPLLPLQSPIIPIVLGTNSKSLEAAASLRARGIVVKAIRSPTVPLGSARLRFSLSLAHSEADLRYSASAIVQAITQVMQNTTSAPNGQNH